MRTYGPAWFTFAGQSQSLSSGLYVRPLAQVAWPHDRVEGTHIQIDVGELVVTLMGIDVRC